MSKARTNNPTEVPGFSKPPADISPALRRYLESITEALDIRLGRRGDARDRAITLRELIDSGLAVELGNNPFNVSAAPPPPPPPPPANGTPTAPTNFSANGGYSIITCFWDYPNYGPHSHTEIWRHTADVIGDAQLVGISSGISFIDPVGGGKTYYYWARHVSLYDIQGPFQAANGDQAVTAVDVDALLAVLTGAITESQLYSNLKNRIDLIDASAAVTNSVAWRVAQEASARATAISNEASARATAINNEATARAAAISASIASLDDVMEYNNSTAYKKGGIVVYNGNLYEAKSSTTGNLPTNTTFWTFLGTYTNVGDIVKNNGSKIVEINTITSDSTSAAAQAIVGLKSTVENPTTGVVATSTALGALTTRVSTAEGNIVSNSSAITSLSDVVNHPTTGLSTRASSSALSALDSRVTAAEGVNTSQSTSITSLQNTIDHPTTGLATRASSAALTALDSRVTTAESTITSQGSSITSLTNTINDPSTGLATKASSAALTALDSRVTSAEGTITSQGTSITSLTNTINHPTTGLATRASSSALSALDSRVTSAEGTITSQGASITSLTNTINDPTTGLATRASSSALSALDSRVTTAESTITSQGSSITSLTNTINHPTTGLATRASSAALSALDSRVSTAEGTITSQGASITSLTNTINDPSTGLATRASSTALSALDTRVTSAEGTITAQGNSITALQSTVNNPTTGVVATANAVSLLTTEIFPNGTAQASYIDQVNAAVGTNTAAIQAEATARANADGTLFGQYTVKVDLNGYVSGFGLASTVNNATPSSEFIVRADRFSIASPGQTTIIPFIVQTSPTTINGVPVDPGVYITDAVIRNGTITTAKIGLAQIDDARIASISAAKISTGSLDAARITVDNVTLDSYYDGSIGRNRLYIPDLGVKTAKIDNLAVSTLKIAGAAITVPQVYTSGEILVSSAIVMTGGGPSYTYNYVGTGNGDYVYVYDPWYGIQDYFFVGAGNGDYTRTVTNTTPTFTGATLVMETPQINIGVDSTAACQFVFYATMDAAHTLDCGQHLFMMMDKYDGNGYLLIGEQRVGTRTYSGDTKAILPITMTYTGTALQNVRIKVVSGTRLVDGNPGQGSNSSYLKNITLSVMGVKR